MKQVLFVFLTFFSLNVFATEKIEIFLDNQKHNYVNLTAIKGMKTENINFYNYATKRMEVYKGIPFLNFLELTVSNQFKNIVEVELIAENDFKYYVSMDQIRKTHSVLSFDRADGDKFVRYSTKNKILVPLGPLYLVWDLKDIPRNERLDYTSVYQIKAINVKTNRLTFGIHENAVDQSVYLGYQTYKKHCLSCHSLGKLGGDVSFDLLQRKTLEKKGERYVLKYILRPSAMNPKTRMLPLPNYKNKMELAHGVVDFLKFMRNPKDLLEKKDIRKDHKSYKELKQLQLDSEAN